jgi:hypothetical protein
MKRPGNAPVEAPSRLEIAPMLAHPERFGSSSDDAFTVVMPSLPGYGFSDPPAAPMSPRAIASIWRRLMREELGFSHYVAHGGDWRAVVTSQLGPEGRCQRPGSFRISRPRRRSRST